MVNAKFDFGFAVALMINDLIFALDHSMALGMNLPATKSVLQNYKKLSTLGNGQLDTSSLIKLLEN
jgi:3-hydroxyisobutyrate dehydrogenase-like beta-hydroxyacid dehydrogenase